MALGQALEMSVEEQEAFLRAVEEARQARSEKRIRTRGSIVRGALRTRGAARRPLPSAEPDEIDAATVLRDLTTDPDLKAAYLNLKRALADPSLRETVLTTLRALAQQSR
ncbi:MAG: hypothetical protein ACE5JX_04655 [Acidobacteriota bacterium]